MAHEITANDNLMLHQQPAWHGLGRVVPEALKPTQIVDQVFPFTVIQRTPFYLGIDGKRVVGEGFKFNIRLNKNQDPNDPSNGNGTQLGTVSENYRVIQPTEMAEFCEALSDQNEVKVETAGSIRNGARMWFLLKGEAFDVANSDTIYPYVLVSNGFDGGSSFRVTPTTIRVVCSNTLHMVIPRTDTGLLTGSGISIRHTSNVMKRIEEAKVALQQYGKAVLGTKKLAEVLSGKAVTSEEVKEFFLKCYSSQIGEIPANPKNGFEERRVQKAQSAYSSFIKRFDDEKGIAGTTAWNMANAWSGLIQHDMKSRGSDDGDRIEKRVDANLFGLGQERTLAGFANAFKFALAD